MTQQKRTGTMLCVISTAWSSHVGEQTVSVLVQLMLLLRLSTLISFLDGNMLVWLPVTLQAASLHCA